MASCRATQFSGDHVFGLPNGVCDEKSYSDIDMGPGNQVSISVSAES